MHERQQKREGAQPGRPAGPNGGVDAYPSRKAPQPRRMARHEPVVHGGGPPPPPLDAQSVARFERDGFLVLENLFAPEQVAAWQAEMTDMQHDPMARHREETVLEPGSDTVRSIFRIHELSRVFSALTRHPFLLGMARHLLGDEVYIHQSRLNFKPGFRGKEFYWHSDFETWHVEDGMPRMRALSMSIALSPNSAHNGPLMLVPGSHRTFISCVGETPEDHYKTSLRRQEYGVPDPDSIAGLVVEGGIVAPTGAPGTVVIFDCNVLHGSNSNITPLPRSNAFFVYNACSNALVEPFGPARRRPPFIASRNFTPLEPLPPDLAA